METAEGMGAHWRGARAAAHRRVLLQSLDDCVHLLVLEPAPRDIQRRERGLVVGDVIEQQRAHGVAGFGVLTRRMRVRVPLEAPREVLDRLLRKRARTVPRSIGIPHVMRSLHRRHGCPCASTQCAYSGWRRRRSAREAAPALQQPRLLACLRPLRVVGRSAPRKLPPRRRHAPSRPLFRLSAGRPRWTQSAKLWNVLQHGGGPAMSAR